VGVCCDISDNVYGIPVSSLIYEVIHIWRSRITRFYEKHTPIYSQDDLVCRWKLNDYGVRLGVYQVNIILADFLLTT